MNKTLQALPIPLDSYLMDINRFKKHSDRRHVLGDILWEKNIGLGEDAEERKEIFHDICEATQINPRLLEGYEKGVFEIRKIDAVATSIYRAILSDGKLYQQELENKISDLNFEAWKLLKDGRERGLKHILKIYKDITRSGVIERSINLCLDDKIRLCIDEREELLDKKAKYRYEKELLQEIEEITGKGIEFVSGIDFTDEEKNMLLNIEQQEDIEKVHDVFWGAYLGPRSVLGYSKFVQYKSPSFDVTENKIIKLIEERGADSNGIKNEDYNTDGIILDKYLKTIGVTGVSADALYKKRKSVAAK